MAEAMFDLTGKVALITGGSRGLGREMALAFADAGADVIVSSRNLESCEAAAAAIRARGRRAVAIAAHAGRWDEVDRLIDAAYAAFGRIDVLIANAGMSPAMASHEISERLFDSVVSLNFKGPFRLASAVAHRMAQGDGGAIIFTSSTAALEPSPMVVPYAGAKAALLALTTSLAHEYAPKVRVNAIAAGPFLTDISKAWADVDRDTARNALGRPGRPDEIVSTALYLASPASSFVTATTIRCDGGTCRSQY
ncbi:MAG: glucose 1-dehydrogenase [Sphingomonas adhaesiva]|uniref:SDR family NAD(P)-dependent oxidoreductase n=1 Tax=Sphingomonas adhaesiva TaxID=28212 RepID=UPI002FF6294B